MKEFKGLLKSEIKKAERLANEITGFNDCKVTGYCEQKEENGFIIVKCEICRNYKERINFDITLSVLLKDRRFSFASTFIDGWYINIKTVKKDMKYFKELKEIKE